MKKKRIIGISGSASKNYSNLFILKTIAELGKSEFDLTLINDLAVLPHFKTHLTERNVPTEVIEFRNQINTADGVIISSPEYIFSIPSGLKNVIEWCVSTTVFSDKPIGIITASASGDKAHQELKLIMKTLQTKFTEETTLLISGIKGKINRSEEIIDINTRNELKKFVQSLISMLI
ncbi:NADPH-dependent FMN reductase [Aquimarina sp. RZ0]|uniref:NADPH-dependent FMN reductase n=1 Tax=Aquimarina sp. RZ0 TaxID=2607730 RepID=UPI0011F0DF0D|nr:NAD(P)H-dependent oxidoreductase [Aquimarina sp. RZ0]KAA1243367.1 NAD(P)H-dependent oxidoreductase [Aquimarina sp. RZ0]